MGSKNRRNKKVQSQTGKIAREKTKIKKVSKETPSINLSI